MSPKPFELRSLPDRGKHRLFLLQLPYKTTNFPNVNEPITVARIDGSSLALARDLVREAIGAEAPAESSFGPDPLDVFLEQGGSVGLEERDALWMGLAFVAINSMRSPEKVAGIIAGVRNMALDEAAYWLKKIVSDPTGNALHAFRMLQAGVD